MVDKVQPNSKKVFFSGVMLLTLSTVLVKLIGLFYKIPMLSYLGAEGMGYFNSAYEIYALFCVIATAGLPVALSVLISEALAKGKGALVARIYSTALAVFLLIGVVGTLSMVLFARRFCHWMQSQNAYACILSISPTVFCVCLSSAIRGYFQGHQKMLPTAISQLLEAAGKLVFGLLLARYALWRGFSTPTVAAYAGGGLTLGTFLSLLYLLLEKLRFDLGQRKQNGTEVSVEEPGSVLRSLGRLAVPMTLGASLVSLTKLIDMTMILRRLQSIGFSEVVANEAYGSYTTLALSVFGLLPTLVNAIALPLVPMLSSAIAAGDREKQEQMIRSCYQLTALFALPAALALSAFATPILQLLFPREPEAVRVAAPLLSYLGISVFLSCMITATNSVLHAYKVVNRPIASMVAGAVIKILSAYFLIGSPGIGLLGAPISTFLCNATVVLLNLWFAARLCPMPSVKEVFLRPFGAALLSVSLAMGADWLMSQLLEPRALVTLLSLGLTCFLYLGFSFAFGGIRAEDLSALPLGEKLLSLVRRMHLLRDEK